MMFSDAGNFEVRQVTDQMPKDKAAHARQVRSMHLVERIRSVKYSQLLIYPRLLNSGALSMPVNRRRFPMIRAHTVPEQSTGLQRQHASQSFDVLIVENDTFK